ncbi:Uncharacterised protein [Salmonella enterica subsp. enterica serovar Bovismorbificans]|uniref:Lipoprotein n=1 Tax=Salmonella enterica subsp. enterica serovar Bovismorbificans TaxID=58097 RepID=A0A655CK35_SALET|nr:Uncharacterised protein [Salmonella enterica subsp. enterica serovar Bovismorbificans]
MKNGKELMKNWQKYRPMLMLLSVLAVGCNSSSQQYNGSSQEVKPAGFPLLPQQARQKPRPEYCSPSCLAKLTIWRESSQKRLMSVMSPEMPVSAPMTK